MIFILLILTTASIFSYCTGMTDTHILPKWLCTLGLAAIAGLTEGFLILFRKQHKNKGMTPFLVVSFLCFCQANYAIIQAIESFSFPLSLQIVGSFDNPAGLSTCLSLGIPSTIYMICKAKRTTYQKVYSILLIIMGIVLVLTKSRAGILAGIFLPVVWWSYSFIKKRWILILTYGLGTILLPIMYMIKKDSADGRLLIFRCAWDMITERPLLGYGVNGIQAHYMDYQAKWLAKHTESSFSYLADNVKHVFNEYLSIGICFGIVGWLILALFAWLIIYCYRRRPSLEGKFALMTIATIGILGCFSYPLSYPFTWIALTLNSYILIHQNTLLNLSPNKHTRYFIAAVLFIVSSLSCYKIISRTYAELEWKRISDIASRGRGNEVFFRYNALMPILGNEPYFLYNYAAELYIAGHYHHALRITQHCQKYWSDYDLEILHGELLNKLNKKEEAEQHFKHASHMCPVRFIPLYKLYQLYKETGNEAKARQIGIIILNKPVKIESEIIQHIKEKIKLSLSYKNI